MYAELIYHTYAMPQAHSKAIKTKHWITQSLTNHNNFGSYIAPLAQLFNRNWQAKGYPARVVDIRKESEHVYSIVMMPHKKWPAFVAGQFIELTAEINGVRYTRIFSISSSPAHHATTGLIELTIQQQEHGKVTPWLIQQLITGSVVNISAAQGDFVLPQDQRPVLMIAGGSGITPFRSQLQQLAAQYPTQNVHLIYYSRGDMALFKAELQQQEECMSHFKLCSVDSTVSGRISHQQLKQLCPDFEHRTAFICGPQGLIQTAREILQQVGVANENIHYELFGPSPIRSLDLKTAGEVTFNQSNRSVKTVMQTSLLELAEHNDINAISGCRMGVCHTCKCRKQQGVVFNTLTETFSDTGAEDIQLCVSVAVGDVTLEL